MYMALIRCSLSWKKQKRDKYGRAFDGKGEKNSLVLFHTFSVLFFGVGREHEKIKTNST